MFQIIKGPLLRQYAIVIAVNLSLLAIGMDFAWPSPVLVKLRNATETPLLRPITEDEGAWIVSIGYLLSVITIPATGYLVDSIGRKASILVVCFPKIIAGLLTIFATKAWMLYLSRSLTGVTNTSAMMVITMYCSEIASEEIRGALGSIMPIVSGLGVLTMLGIGPYISYTTLSVMFTTVVVCTFVPLLFIPDTPYSLYSRGKIEEAERVLTTLRGSKSQAQEVLNELSRPQTDKLINKKEIFKDKAFLKGLLIAVVLGIGIQGVGFNSVSFYLQTLLELSHTSVSPELGSVIVGVIQILSSTVTTTITDRFGRKPILISTSLGLAVGMIGLGSFFIVKENYKEINGFMNYLPLISIGIITCCYNGGIGSQFFVVVSEVLDAPTRALGISLSWIGSTITLFVLARYTPALISVIGPAATFFTFSAICVLLAMFVLFVMPETKQKTIAEIQRALRGEKPSESRSTE